MNWTDAETSVDIEDGEVVIKTVTEDEEWLVRMGPCESLYLARRILGASEELLGHARALGTNVVRLEVRGRVR